MAIFKIDYKNNHKIINVLGFKIKTNRSLYKKVNKLFKRNKNFDCRQFDNQIAQLTDKALENYHFQKNEINNNRIAILATLFYDMGGHTECVKNVAKLLNDKYEIKIFLTSKDEAYSYAPNKIKLIEQYSKIDGIDSVDDRADSAKLIDMFEKINEFSPRVLFVYMNTCDCIATALLYLLKKYTDIKIIFDNHASHYPTLGMSFVDGVVYQLPSAHYITKKYRKIDKGININLCSEKLEEIVDISDVTKSKIRKSLGIKDKNFFSLSGASSYKFFSEKKSEYFEMIKSLLEEEPHLQHIVITNLNPQQRDIVDNIFKDSLVRDRLSFINFTPNYSEIFQSCDLFIDSFPCGSALTHVDLMKHKKMSVVKINKQNALQSFHEFFPSDYPHMFSNVEDMKNDILFLIKNNDEIKKYEQILYNHYLNTFEGNFVRNQLINVIEKSENLKDLYYKMPENVTYNVEFK